MMANIAWKLLPIVNYNCGSIVVMVDECVNRVRVRMDKKGKDKSSGLFCPTK